MRPASGFRYRLLIVPVYPPPEKLPPALRMSWNEPPPIAISRTPPS